MLKGASRALDGNVRHGRICNLMIAEIMPPPAQSKKISREGVNHFA